VVRVLDAYGVVYILPRIWATVAPFFADVARAPWHLSQFAAYSALPAEIWAADGGAGVDVPPLADGDVAPSPVAPPPPPHPDTSTAATAANVKNTVFNLNFINSPLFVAAPALDKIKPGTWYRVINISATRLSR
jgi:hypothetical protein